MLFKHYSFNKEAYCGPNKRDMKTVLFFYLRQTLRCHYLDVNGRVEPSTCLSKEPQAVAMQVV